MEPSDWRMFAVKRIVSLLFVTLSAVSCTTAQLDLPQSLASSSEVVPVRRAFWTQSASPLSFGDYTVTDFHDAKKTRVRSDSVAPVYVPDVPGIPRVKDATTKQTIRFMVNDGGAPRWNVLCQSRSDENSLESSGGSVDLPGHFRGETVCAIDGVGDGAGNDAARWTLNLSHYRPGLARTSIRGELTDGSTTYDLTPLYRVVGGGDASRGVDLPYPLGFAIRSGDAAVAAIDSLGEGRSPARIHFGRNLDPTQRSLIAAVSAAVLLQQEDRGGVTIGR
jgi:hypothetical protein